MTVFCFLNLFANYFEQFKATNINIQYDNWKQKKENQIGFSFFFKF